ncbi:cysteine-rich receptor-like protein kinase 8 [Tanacetum coccineum]
MTTLIIASNITLDGLDSLEALAVSLASKWWSHQEQPTDSIITPLFDRLALIGILYLYKGQRVCVLCFLLCFPHCVTLIIAFLDSYPWLHLPTPLAVFQNPLYIHPSDGPSSLTVQEKLTGAQNYKAWKRALEIGLSTKRKLGFVKGTVVCSATDENLAEL